MTFCLVFVPSVQIYQNLVVRRSVNPGMGFVFQTAVQAGFMPSAFLKNVMEIEIAQIRHKIQI
jgi:hypothetical protein